MKEGESFLNEKFFYFFPIVNWGWPLRAYATECSKNIDLLADYFDAETNVLQENWKNKANQVTVNFLFQAQQRTPH